MSVQTLSFTGTQQEIKDAMLMWLASLEVGMDAAWGQKNAPAAPPHQPIGAGDSQPAPSTTPVAPPPVAAPAPVPVAPSPAPVAALVSQPQLPGVPVAAAPTYSQDQLAVACASLWDAGKAAELQQLMGQFSISALTQLPQEQYGAFATALRGLGAQL